MIKREYLIGIDYFPGWWEPEPNFWIMRGTDWRKSYPERVPLLGEYNTQSTMDAEITAASDRDVDFFLFLWYPSSEFYEDNFKMLNNGIPMFINSPNVHRMKFAIEYCNHEPYPPLDDEIWDRQCRLWCDYMRHPSYLRIGGKAYYKIHGVNHFLAQHDGDGELCVRRILRLREIARESGVGELLLCAGAVADEKIDGELKKIIDVCDVHGTYGELPDMPKTDTPYPFEILVDKARERWDKSINEPFLPYIPFIMAGWDPRPWNDSRASYDLPTREQWRTALVELKHYLDTYPELSVPDGTDKGQKMLTIYSWNEFGEGGIMAPTVGDGYMKLDVLHEVFRK